MAGLDLVRFAAPVVESALLERLLRILDLLAHGLVAVSLGLAIAAWGLAMRSRRLARAGILVVLSVALGGLLVNVLKPLFQVPRPHGVGTWSFPSGHATTAFAVAAALGRVFPATGPLLSVLALFAGLARVYFRDHWVIDVVAGAVLGAAGGLAVAKWTPGSIPRPKARPRRVAWAVAAVIGVGSLAWLGVYERELAAHLAGRRVASGPAPNAVAIPFGSEQARGFLTAGWSGDERWEGSVPFVWAEGREATLRIPPLAPADHRARIRMIPFQRGQGLSCQVVEVVWNGRPLARILLDRGWNEYELAIPAGRIRPSVNDMKMRFASSGRPAGRHDTRLLSAAFSSLEFHGVNVESLNRGHR